MTITADDVGAGIMIVITALLLLATVYYKSRPPTISYRQIEEARRLFLDPLRPSDRIALIRQVMTELEEANDFVSMTELADRTGARLPVLYAVVADQRKLGRLEVDVRHSAKERVLFDSVRITELGRENHRRQLLRNEYKYSEHNEYNVQNDSGVVILRSNIKGSTLSIATRYGDQRSGPVMELTRLVEESRDERALEALSAFLDELDKEQPRRVTLESLFETMQRVVPTLSQATDLLSKITALVA